MTSTAPLSAGWSARLSRRDAGWLPAGPGSAGSPPIQGPNDPNGLRVELHMGDYGWVDVSSNVYYRDMIRISRGRSNETSQVPPQTAGFTLNNRGGIFTPRFATGPYYGLIGKNTQVRISRTWNGQRFYRYAGEVPAWPTTSDISGKDVYEQIQAAGPLRRIQQGSAPLRSPMFRACTSGLTATLVTAYWPCEDIGTSTSFASGLSGGTPMTIVGAPQLSSNTQFVCSAAIPAINGSTWSAPIAPYANTTANVLRFLIAVPAAGDPSAAEIARMTTTGTVSLLQLAYNTTPSIQVQVLGSDVNGNSLFNVAQNFNLNGAPVRMSLELIQSAPGTVTWAVVTVAPGQTVGEVMSGTISGTVGQATSIAINPHINGAIPANPAGLTTTAVGHVTYQPTWDSLFDLSNPMAAWLDEAPDAVQTNDLVVFSPPTSRFTRLCLEQGVNPVVVTSAAGYDADSGPTPPVGMGPQTIDTWSSLIQQVPDTTAGMMFEPRDQVGVTIRTRASLYNQTPKLTLDHSLHQLSGPLAPLDDDQQVRNDIIVQRINGSSATLVQTTGPLSVQPPPAGAGDYQTQYQLSLASDSLLADAVGWRLHLGTVNEPRYPSISLNLRHPTFTGNTTMMNAALSLDIGDRILIVNPPPELPPDPISLIVQGYTETLGIYEHDMVINCSPESPYEVALLDDATLGRLDTDGSTLAAPYPLGTEATIQVATTNPASPPWTTAAGDFPFDIAVAGERMTVTNIGAVPAPPTGVDGTFETGVTGWILTNGTLAQSSAQAHSGSFSGLLTTTSMSTALMSTAQFPVTVGATYVLGYWMRLASGAPPFQTAFLRWSDAGGNFLVNSATATLTPVASWANRALQVQAPAGAAFLQVQFNLIPNAAGDAAYFDDVTFVQTTGGMQPFTVTRSVNGVVKPQASGADVRLWQPMILSL